MVQTVKLSMGIAYLGAIGDVGTITALPHATGRVGNVPISHLNSRDDAYWLSSLHIGWYSRNLHASHDAFDAFDGLFLCLGVYGF